MIFALVDGEITDARGFQPDTNAIGRCLHCGEKVVLERKNGSGWSHLTTEAAALCGGDQPEQIAALKEMVEELEWDLAILEEENKDLKWRLKCVDEKEPLCWR